MKAQFIVLFICLSGSLLAQNKKEQDELMKQYESKRLVYDSLYGEHEEKLRNFDVLLNTYRQEQNKLTQSYESAFSVKNRATKKYIELAGINKLPENFSKQQLDTIRLYKLNEFRTPNWNAIRAIESQERIPAINWKEIPKKERGSKLQDAVNELEQANSDFRMRINEIGEQSEDLTALSEELLRFKKLNEERSKLLLSLDWKLDEQRSKYQEYFSEDRIGGFDGPPPPPVTEEKKN